MIFIDDMKRAWKVMFHPEENTKVTMDSIGALIQYYKISFLPVLAVIIIEILLSAILAAAIAAFLSASLHFVASHLPALYGNALVDTFGVLVGILALFLLIVGTIFYAWFAIPFYAFVTALIYHILGKYIFRVFKNEFDNTASAFMYSVMPLALFSWVIVIPIIGIIASLILYGWSITILVYSLSNQEGISKKMAGLVIFGIGIIALIVWALTGL